MRSSLVVVGSLVLIAAGAYIAWPSHPKTDEEQLKEIVSSCAKAASAHDVTRLTEPVSANYHGEFGDRSSLRSALGYLLLSSHDLLVEPANVRVKVDGATATVDFVAGLLRAGAPGGETRVGSRFIHVDFEKTKDGWQAVSAKSRESTAADLVP